MQIRNEGSKTSVKRIVCIHYVCTAQKIMRSVYLCALPSNTSHKHHSDVGEHDQEAQTHAC